VSKRLRILAVVMATVFAALALTVVVAGPDVTPVDEGFSTGFDAADDAVEHTARPGTRVAALLPLALGAFALVTPLLRRRIAPTPRRSRRIGDVGDDWRALLLGAPPHAA
jgi:hypothetical protein